MNKDMCLHTHTHTICTRMFMVAFHNIKKKKKKGNSPGIHQQESGKKYSAMKRNEPLIQAT